MAAFLGSRGRRARAAAAAARARPGLDTFADAAAGRPQRAGDGPARPAALPAPRTRSSTSCPARRSTTSRGSPAPARRSRWSSSATWAAPSAATRPARARGRRCPARSACSASASCPSRPPSRRSPRAARRRLRRRRAAPRRRLPELRRAAGGRERLLRPRDLGAPAPGQGALRPAGRVQGQPPRPAGGPVLTATRTRRTPKAHENSRHDPFPNPLRALSRTVVLLLALAALAAVVAPAASARGQAQAPLRSSEKVELNIYDAYLSQQCGVDIIRPSPAPSGGRSTAAAPPPRRPTS